VCAVRIASHEISIRGQKANRFRTIAESAGWPTGVRHGPCVSDWSSDIERAHLAGTRVGEGDLMKPSTPSPGSRESRSQSLPVLVVDDNDEVREALSEVLRTEGFGVATASDGKEAWTYLQSHGASLVLLDLKMPIVDGVSFLQLFRSAARKNERLAKVPIVVVSAERSRLLPPGIRMLTKPCDFDELVDLARTASMATA
jgi:CheY-like chemotaxis protein